MAIYTVHVPDAAPDWTTQAERTVLLRDGFSLRAFLFGLVYLLWHRLWIAAAGWVACLVLIGAFARLLHPPLATLVALSGLMHLYLGFEGAELRRYRLARRGSTLRDLVSAPSLADAERLFFTRQPLAPATPPGPVAGAPVAGMRAPMVPAVIGVFPGDDP